VRVDGTCRGCSTRAVKGTCCCESGRQLYILRALTAGGWKFVMSAVVDVFFLDGQFGLLTMHQGLRVQQESCHSARCSASTKAAIQCVLEVSC
jgi:hypothetical protein